MPDKTKTKELLFTPKPGKYPSHKGGRTWLHDRGGVRKVKHGDKLTPKVFPREVLQAGDTVELPLHLAKTYLKRYECFSDPSASSTPKPESSSKGDDEE